MLGLACSCGGRTNLDEGSSAAKVAADAAADTGAAPDALGATANPIEEWSMCDDDYDCEGHTCYHVFPGLSSCAIIGSETDYCRSRLDECCQTSDCAQGRCLHERPTDGSEAHNVCAVDQCKPGSCGPGGICMIAGTTRDYAVCITAMCQSNLDCNREPDGKCRMVKDSCTNQTAYYCLYPGRGCRADAHCISDAYYCGRAPNGTDMECLPKPRSCP